MGTDKISIESPEKKAERKQNVDYDNFKLDPQNTSKDSIEAIHNKDTNKFVYMSKNYFKNKKASEQNQQQLYNSTDQNFYVNSKDQIEINKNMSQDQNNTDKSPVK